SIKVKLFLPLCLASQGPFQSLRQRVPSPPRTPHPLRKSLERDGERPRRTPTPSRPPRPTLNFDDDEETNKENQPPDYEEEQLGAAATLHQLLKKWGQELDQFQNTVCRDLDDFKKRLGIRH
ncbi:E4, partial [Human papillomavirus 132]